MKATYRIKKEELFSTPLPVKTRTYKPVSHKQLADTTLEAIHKAGFTLDKEIYTAAIDGEIANARYTIRDVADEEMQLEIGWQNSYNKQLTLKFAIGTQIFICQNGCVSGNMGSFKRKHTGDVVDFAPLHMIESIKKSGETFREIQSQRDRMKEIELSSDVRAALLGQMFFEEDLIRSSQLNIIKDEIKKPTFDYKCPNSLWEVYNFATFAMRDNNPRTWMSDHIRLHDFFNKSAMIDGIKRPAIIDVTPPVEVAPNQTNLLDEISSVTGGSWSRS